MQAVWAAPSELGLQKGKRVVVRPGARISTVGIKTQSGACAEATAQRLAHVSVAREGLYLLVATWVHPRHYGIALKDRVIINH